MVSAIDSTPECSLRGVFLDLATVGSDLNLEPLYSRIPNWQLHAVTRPEQIVERAADADVIVLNKVAMGESEFAALPRLKLVLTAATGYDQIDLTAASNHGVTVCNARNYATESVAQHVFAMLLNLLTRIERYTHDARAGRWVGAETFCLLDYPVRELSERTVGIIGYGVLGRRVAALAQAFGARVLVADSLRDSAHRNPLAAADHGVSSSVRGGDTARRRGGAAARTVPARHLMTVEPPRLPLDCLLSASDVISLHLPLSPETKQLLDAARIARMKRGSILVNTARGGLVDPYAVAQALRSGHLGGACIDVLETEPPPADHPLLAVDIPNLILTPHTAWASSRARQNVIGEIAANIAAFLAKRPRNVVNRIPPRRSRDPR